MDDAFSAGDFTAAESAIASPASADVETSAAVSDTPGPVTLETADPAATVQASATSPVSDHKGPIPFEVHHKALENARTKAKDDTLAEWRQQHGWAEQLPRDQVQKAVNDWKRIHENPIQHIQDLVAEMQAHPTWGPQLRSQSGRMLAAFRQPREPEPTSIDPDVEITDANGQVVGRTYSDKQLQRRDAMLEQQILDKVLQRMNPLEKMRAQVEGQQRQQEQIAKIDQQLATATEKWPHFAEHTQAIAKEVEGGLELKDAYLTVLARDILPSLTTTDKVREAKVRADLLTDLSKKPKASTMSPSGGSVSVPKPDSSKSWEELIQEAVSASA